MSEDMQKLLDFIKNEVEELPEGLEDQVEELWPETSDEDDLFTQEDLDDIVQRRLAREREAHEQETEELKEKNKELMDPSEYEELEEKYEELEEKGNKREGEWAKEERLRSQAIVEGVSTEAVDDFVKTVDKDQLDYDPEEDKVKGIDDLLEKAQEEKSYFFEPEEGGGQTGSDFSGEGEGDNYFTREQVEKMDEDEMMENKEDINKSQEKWE